MLTGTHAGAQIPLAAGTYRVGAAENSDICITDWAGPALSIEVDETGIVTARECGEGEQQGVAVLIQDFVAAPFGSIILCVGPQDAQWPSDVELLSGLWTKKPDTQAAKHRDTSQRRTAQLTGLALAGTMVGSLLVAGVMLFGTQESQAISTAPNTDALAANVSDTLHGMGLTGLTAVPRGNTIVVQGMVSSPADDVAARTTLGRYASNQIDQQYDVASDDARSIQESLAIDSARVAYLGNGAFRISGTVPSLSQFHEALSRVRKDLDANVKRIDVAVKESSPAQQIASTDYSEMMSIGDVRYIETPDGVKHLYPAGGRTTN
ncbi:type III secretion system protein [Burkholderia sp. WAC0059]|nr:type III secretion system protein [Burkholderia sp. WAC0059]